MALELFRVVHVSVCLESGVIKVSFFVCGNFQVDFIFCTELIDRNVRDIHIQERTIELMDGT